MPPRNVTIQQLLEMPINSRTGLFRITGKLKPLDQTLTLSVHAELSDVSQPEHKVGLLFPRDEDRDFRGFLAKLPDGRHVEVTGKMSRNINLFHVSSVKVLRPHMDHLKACSTLDASGPAQATKFTRAEATSNDCQSDDTTIPAPPTPDWEKVARYYQNQVKNLRTGLEYKSFILDLTVRAMGLQENKNKELAETSEFHVSRNYDLSKHNLELLRENEKLKKDSDFWADEAQKLAAQVATERRIVAELDEKLHDSDDNLKGFLKENAGLKAELEALKAQQKKATQDLMKALAMYGDP